MITLIMAKHRNYLMGKIGLNIQIQYKKHQQDFSVQTLLKLSAPTLDRHIKLNR